MLRTEKVAKNETKYMLGTRQRKKRNKIKKEKTRKEK